MSTERFARTRLALKKLLWRTTHGRAEDSTAVFVLGAQRSGTTILIRCMEKSMQFDVYGEASSAMHDWRIRDDVTIQRILEKSAHPIVVFKPLTDSHRAKAFLELWPQSFALWSFRKAEDRANSSVAKFGDHNLEILRDLKNGIGFDRWQALGISERLLELVRSFDYDTLSPYEASAVFWYIRNSLFLEQDLDKDPRVLPIAYEDMVTDPKRVIGSVCSFIGAEFDPAITDSVHGKSIGRSESRLSQEISDMCQELYDELRQAQRARWTQAGLPQATS